MTDPVEFDKKRQKVDNGVEFDINLFLSPQLKLTKKEACHSNLNLTKNSNSNFMQYYIDFQIHIIIDNSNLNFVLYKNHSLNLNLQNTIYNVLNDQSSIRYTMYSSSGCV